MPNITQHQQKKKVVLTKLASLVSKIDATVESFVNELTPEEIEFVLANFAGYLQLDLKTPFNKKRERHLTTSPLDDILNSK